MGTAYTPGLTVNDRALIRKTRRLPLKGEVLVAVGDHVAPDTPIARTELPGEVILVRAAERLGVQGDELLRLLRRQVGEAVEKGEVLAETPGLFGRFFKTQLESPVEGTLETATERTGNLTIRRPPKPVVLQAYLRGTVAEVIDGEGAVIESRGALVQGIFGIGGERNGELLVLAAPDEAGLDGADGRIVVVPGQVSAAFYRAAAGRGAAAVVGGSVLDGDLRDILGYDIGVAITGEEKVDAALVVTEGFGDVAMADRTQALLRNLDGREASLSGATQIRAGVIRPEIIVPDLTLSPDQLAGDAAAAQTLDVGAHIRLIREPYFGRLATVTELPPEPVEIDTGAVVRVLGAELEGGERVTVPRANVEIVVG